MKVCEIDLISAYATLNTSKAASAVSTETSPPDRPTNRRKTGDTHRQLDEKLYRSLTAKLVTEVARTEWQEKKWEWLKADRDVD